MQDVQKPEKRRLIPTSRLGVEKGITYSRAHLDRLIKAGKFPVPVKIGAGRNVFVEDEIDAYIEARINERDAGLNSGAA